MNERKYPKEDARVFELEEDDWNIMMDRLSLAKLSRPQRNLQLGPLAKMVSGEMIF